MKKVLVLGASGATGQQVVKALLNKNIEVIAVVRPASAFEHSFQKRPNYNQVNADILSMDETDLCHHLKECDVVVSCLGHNLTFKGIFGQPRLLVTDVIKKVAKILSSLKLDQKVKVILMNTSGNPNRDIPEKPPLSQRFVVALLRLLVPPHVDNEKAADFLRTTVGQENPYMEWSIVRPDGLINEAEVSDYDVHYSPISNVIFNAGTVSRINVADFMSRLAIDKALWQKWKGQMPVIYNSDK
ncbi:NAD(P)-dependent oxidoreductase [Marinicella rhabdoformis]|uniref:NAD(P)-dependent oxidoreductase n=1 Tax=Marinicella rhabdoformis TaxID=2580566 RepID=UPI0012AED152|nr:NAD(P)-binding oxidoreductase [Marinicella rhabdoformis]